MSKKTIPESLFEKIAGRNLYIVLLIILILGLVIFYKPMAIDGLEPQGGDVMKSLGQSHQITTFQEKTGERSLWNPNIFTGIPTYFSQNSKSFNLDKIISFLNQTILDWRVSWFLVGAVGMFLLLSTLGFPWYIRLVGVIAFIFWPHFQGLIEVGHNAKVRAVLAMPLVIFGFIHYVKKRDLISILWFSLFFSLQFRTHHYQVIFYTLVVLLGVGIFYIVKWLKEKKYAQLGKTVAIFFGALIFSILMSAQPLFVAGEYTPYSTRGGKAINLNEKPAEQAKKSGGVTFDYATRWSFSPKEMMTLISPRFLGGTSQEPYTGKQYSHLKNQKLPTYWGDMPFTQSSEYIGVIIVVLAVFGVFANRKNGLVITFSVLALFSILLSFGRHFPPLYKALFYYLPYFDKFRAPSMTLILVTFNIIILAMYGLKSLLEIDSKEKFMPLAIIAGVFAFLGLIFIIAPNLLSYTSAGDAHYASRPQVLEILKSIRREYVVADNLKMLLYLICFVALVALFFMKKIKKELLISGVLLLVAIESISVSYKFIDHAIFFNKKSAEREYFREGQFNKIIKQDKDYVRVLELGQGFTSNDLAYHHQIIHGYSAIKPQLIQDIVDNNLYKSHEPGLPINLKIVSMLNGKYIVSPGTLQHSDLAMIAVNQQQKKVLYQNKKALPRVFFIEKTLKLDTEKAVVKFMNTAQFQPDSIALVSNDKLTEKSYNTAGKAEITEYTPNQVVLNTSNEGEGFLILSEAYFPIGWTCTIDDKSTEIYQVNHILRGIEVPSGNHEIVFTFEPKSYKRAQMISNITTYLAWIALIALLIIRHKEALLTIVNKKTKKK